MGLILQKRGVWAVGGPDCPISISLSLRSRREPGFLGRVWRKVVPPSPPGRALQRFQTASRWSLVALSKLVPGESLPQQSSQLLPMVWVLCSLCPP